MDIQELHNSLPYLKSTSGGQKGSVYMTSSAIKTKHTVIRDGIEIKEIGIRCDGKFTYGKQACDAGFFKLIFPFFQSEFFFLSPFFLFKKKRI